jgi:hypothetical protein
VDQEAGRDQVNKLIGSVFCGKCGEDIPVEHPIVKVSTYPDKIYVTLTERGTNGPWMITIDHECKGATK